MAEKELQLKELMAILGLSNWMHWLAWYVKSFILFFICSLIIALGWTVLVMPGAKVALLPFTSFPVFLVFLMVYSNSCICFCFLVSAMCSKQTWSGFITCLLYIATFLPILFMPSSSEGPTSSIVTCLFFNSAMATIITRIQYRETAGEGLQWNNIFETLWANDHLSVGDRLLIMLAVSLISLLICLYLEQIHPGEYGEAKPWYFLCTKRYWCGSRFIGLGFWCHGSVPPLPSDVERPAEKSTVNHKFIEEPPKDKIAGIEIRNLRKSYGSLEAVQGLTLKMYQDEITVLLGHNGAGKTTTILMLAGIQPPTSGTALINGYDIRTERQQARLSMGICPQHNILFSGLSVSGHLSFFCRLRGLRGVALKQEVNKFLEKLKLKPKASAMVGDLSGGTQRRLSLACAMCGQVKVVFCDEPASGLDPDSRHDLWKLMLEEKQGRTILLTTHFMDEGEVLGDRIVIMSEGQLRCHGTLTFLKKTHDTGYTLSCEKGPNCKVGQLTALISNYVPHVQVQQVGTDVKYRLPQRYSSSFASLFADLEQHQKELDVLGFGLGASSLADIFMSVGAEEVATRKEGGTEQQPLQRSGCCQRCLSQWEAMLRKKLLHTYNQKLMLLIILFIPICLWLASLIKGATTSDLPRLEMSLSAYKKLDVLILMQHNSNNISSTFEELVKPFDLERVDKELSTYMLDLVKDRKTRQQFKSRYLIAVALDESQMLAVHNSKTFPHSAPLALNLVYNSLAKATLGPNVSIELANAPYPDPNDHSLGRAVFQCSNVILYLSIATAIFVLFVVQERVTQLKMQQQVAGVNMLIYWITHYIWDFMIYMAFVLALVVAVHEDTPLDYILFILALLGLAALPFTYVFGSMFKGGVTALSVLIVINMTVGRLVKKKET